MTKVQTGIVLIIIFIVYAIVNSIIQDYYKDEDQQKVDNCQNSAVLSHASDEQWLSCNNYILNDKRLNNKSL